MLRRVLLFIAGALVAGDLCALGVIASGTVTPGVSLATTNNHASSNDTELPETESVIVETTTTTTEAPPTTTSTTGPAVTTTTHVPQPTTTTTSPVPANSVVIESITNNYPYAIEWGVGSGTSFRAVFEPGQPVGPITIVVGPRPPNDNSGGFVVTAPGCGNAGNDNFFTPGHRYTVEFVENMPNGCDGVPNYFVILSDLTTGTSRHID